MYVDGWKNLPPNYRRFADFSFSSSHNSNVFMSERMEMTVFLSCFFSFAERHYNEMTRHHQFPVMQLPEGAQSLNNPKNSSSVASPSLTSSLINNNCLLTLREMMQHQQQYQLHQYHQQSIMMHHKKRENVDEKPQIISASSPNSSIKLSPKYHAEKHERESPFLSMSRAETMHRGSRNEAGANCFKHVKAEGQATGRTVREELEASRNKIPKPGKVSSQFLNRRKHSFQTALNTLLISK